MKKKPTKKEPEFKLPEPQKDFSSTAERDQYFKDHAEYFTVVKFKGVGQFDRTEVKSLAQAQGLAKIKATIGGGKWMIYAVIGNSSAYVQTIG